MRFVVEADILHIRFEGLEQFWAFKRRLTIIKADIVSASWNESMAIPRSDLSMKMGGVGIPGLLYAGQFKGREGLKVMYLHAPQRQGSEVVVNHVLVLDIRNSRYCSLLFTIEDPHIAEQIVSWWASPS